jgi:hypothetical protein
MQVKLGDDSTNPSIGTTPCPLGFFELRDVLLGLV